VDVKKGKTGLVVTSPRTAVHRRSASLPAKIEVNDNEDSTLAYVQVGDEVKVQVKAAPTATTPLTARQLEVKNDEDSSSDDS
jgi:hypothetical protein